MRKRVIAFVLMLSMAVSVSGCGNDGENKVQNGEEVSLFEELKGNRLVFASGAGAWGTELQIAEDGSFQGQYHDSDMGSTGEGYPKGTRYFSEFTGQFSEPEKVNEYTYKMTINEIKYANEVGSEEILDEILHSNQNPTFHITVPSSHYNQAVSKDHFELNCQSLTLILR